MLQTSESRKLTCPFTSRDGQFSTLCTWSVILAHTNCMYTCTYKASDMLHFSNSHNTCAIIGIAAREVCLLNSTFWQSYTLAMTPVLAVRALKPNSIRRVYTRSMHCHVTVISSILYLWDALRSRSCYIGIIGNQHVVSTIILYILVIYCYNAHNMTCSAYMYGTFLPYLRDSVPREQCG